MIRGDFFRKIARNFTVRHASSDLNQVNIQKLETEATDVVIDDELREREEALEKKRNKSRLKEYHRNLLHEQNPYSEEQFWYHGTLKYMRRTYGRYGAASGVNPALCWPIKDELEDTKEYERLKYPHTVPELIKQAKQQREEKEQRIWERQNDIIKKMERLEQWKKELHDKISKKENEAIEAKMRKERLIEEVRRHFGYTVDPRDDRFKELLEKKEKEQKKAMKEARKKAREEKAVQRVLKTSESTGQAQEVKNE